MVEDKEAKVGCIKHWLDVVPLWPWRWRRQLLEWEKDLVQELELLLGQVTLKENVKDKWIWEGDPISIVLAMDILQRMLNKWPQ